MDPALIVWTSGSTGRPRGVVLQHHAVLANMWANIRSLGYRDDDRTLLALPLSHAYPLVHQCLCHLALGATVCIPPTPLVGPILCRALENFSITTLTTVPPLLRILVEGLRRGRRSHSSLRLVTVGAGRADPAVVRDFLRLLPATQLVITYGLTEAGPRVSSSVVDREHINSECVGTPLPNVEVRTSSEDGAGQRILLRGRSLMRSYADDPWVEGTDATFCTADLGELEGGKLYFRGRVGRAINRGGVLVAAEEVERVLLEHPAVVSARVEREEHSFWGEIPVATVCLRPGAESVTPAELDRFCAERLPSFGRPTRIEVCSAPE
ncbi:MAG: fatty acid--CoA ligase family protein, partial [Acidobacteriota bacterium]